MVFEFVEKLAAPLIVVANIQNDWELYEKGYDMNRIVDLDNEIRRCFDVESVFDGKLALGNEYSSNHGHPLMRIGLTRIRELCILHLHRIPVAEYLDDPSDMTEHGFISMLATLRSARAVRLGIENYHGFLWRIRIPNLHRTVLYLMHTLISVVRFMHPKNPICAFALEEMMSLLEIIFDGKFDYYEEMNVRLQYLTSHKQ